MDKEEWERDCQTFEIEFQSKENYRWDDEAFLPAWQKHFFSWCNLLPSDLLGRVVIDIGCGSRPAVDVFEGSVRYYIDPLIEKFVHIERVSRYWDPYHIAHGFCMEAETRFNMLRQSATFINLWNTLDHCYNWRKVLENAFFYALPGCALALGTDVAPHRGHPGIDAIEELFIMCEAECDLVKEEPGYWGRQVATLWIKK